MKVVLRGEFIALHFYIKKKKLKRYHTDNLMMDLKALGKQT
jgi:hypothetical protein